jgi:hypothetical protein
MVEKKGKPQAKDTINEKKKILAAIQAKREGKDVSADLGTENLSFLNRISAEDISVINLQLQGAAALRRRPFSLSDNDPTDPITFFDLDPNDRVIRI